MSSQRINLNEPTSTEIHVRTQLNQFVMRNRNPISSHPVPVRGSEDGASAHANLKTWVDSGSPRVQKEKKEDNKSTAVVPEHDAVCLEAKSSTISGLN